MTLLTANGGITVVSLFFTSFSFFSLIFPFLFFFPFFFNARLPGLCTKKEGCIKFLVYADWPASAYCAHPPPHSLGLNGRCSNEEKKERREGIEKKQ